jgi:hypothetical protein
MIETYVNLHDPSVRSKDGYYDVFFSHRYSKFIGNPTGDDFRTERLRSIADRQAREEEQSFV